MKEHRKEIEQREGRKYSRSTKRQSQSEQNKLSITDHVNTENRKSRYQLGRGNSHRL